MESSKDPKLDTLLEENKQNATKPSIAQLFNKCYSKRPLVILLILHSSFLLYYFIYMTILFPNKFTVTLGNGKIVEIVPQINWELIEVFMKNLLLNACIPICLEIIYLKFGNVVKKIVKWLLYCFFFYKVFLGYVLVEYILSTRSFGIESYSLQVLFIVVFILTYKFKDGAFLSTIPQIVFCSQTIFEIFIPMLTRYTKPLLEVNEIGVSHHIHGILDDLVKKYNFDKNIVFFTGFRENELKAVTNLGDSAYQTQFEDSIFLYKQTVMEESVDYLKFAVYHEYGHLQHNHGKFLHLLRNSVNLFILAAICYAIYSNLRSSKPKDKTRLALGLISYSFLATVIYQFSENIIRNFIEFDADDFSVSLQGNLSGIDAFLLITKDESMDLENNLGWTLFHPSWLPYFDHPSVYHRHLRQVARIK